VDGGLIGMGYVIPKIHHLLPTDCERHRMMPNEELPMLFDPHVKISGGDICCANSEGLEGCSIDYKNLIASGNRSKLPLNEVMSRVWKLLVETGCNQSIKYTQMSWMRMFSGSPNQRVRVFRTDGCPPGKSKPQLANMSAQEFRDMYECAKQWTIEKSKEPGFDPLASGCRLVL